MSKFVTWLEDVKAIRFSISYSAALGTTDPEALAVDAILKANIARMGLRIAPKLSITGSVPGRPFFMSAYESTDFSYLIRANSFTSIEAITHGVLSGFREHISTTPFPSYGGSMEYTFKSPFEKEDGKEKLTAYLSAQAATNAAADDVTEGPRGGFCPVQ
jgi:hypothetical protein